jgi:hypothetical protein
MGNKTVPMAISEQAALAIPEQAPVAIWPTGPVSSDAQGHRVSD